METASRAPVPGKVDSTSSEIPQMQEQPQKKMTPEEEAMMKFNMVIQKMRANFAAVQGQSNAMITDQYNYVFNFFMQHLEIANSQIAHYRQVLTQQNEELNVWRSGKKPDKVKYKIASKTKK